MLPPSMFPRKRREPEILVTAVASSLAGHSWGANPRAGESRGGRSETPMKTRVCLITALLLSAPLLGPLWGDEFRRGDCNADGSTGIVDAIFLLNALFIEGSTQPTCQDACDTNDNGAVDIVDAIFLLGILHIPGAPQPPPPGIANCGPDPTDDPLECLEYLACP